MKIAIKHRTNNCKDYMGSHRYYWKFNRAYDTAEQYLFVRRIGLGYTVGFLRRDVTARSRGGGRRWCKQLSGSTRCDIKKRNYAASRTLSALGTVQYNVFQKALMFLHSRENDQIFTHKNSVNVVEEITILAV